MDIKYIAGLIDADGSITLRKLKMNGKEYYQACIMFSNTNKNIVEDMNKIMKAKIDYFKSEGKAKDQYSIQQTGDKVIKLLKQMEPYLRIKKERAQLCIELYEFKNQTLIDIKRKEEKIWKRMRKLNKRGK